MLGGFVSLVTRRTLLYMNSLIFILIYSR